MKHRVGKSYSTQSLIWKEFVVKNWEIQKQNNEDVIDHNSEQYYLKRTDNVQRDREQENAFLKF